MRHARTDKVNVVIKVEQQMLLIWVKDRGSGFDQAALSPRYSSGLFGMHERTNSLGGELVVESKSGTGTVISAQLPIADNGDTKWQAWS